MTRPAYLVQDEISDTPLFGPSRKVKREKPRAPYQPTSDTSHAAAVFIQPRITRMEQLVLDAIEKICATGMHGATVFDAKNWLGLEKDNVAPRFTSLARKRLIRKTEKRHPHEGSETWAWAWELIKS